MAKKRTATKAKLAAAKPDPSRSRDVTLAQHRLLQRRVQKLETDMQMVLRVLKNLGQDAPSEPAGPSVTTDGPNAQQALGADNAVGN